MYLRTFKICVLKYLNLILLKIDILTDIDMLLMVEECIRGGLCHAVYRYVKAENKYMKDYD